MDQTDSIIPNTSDPDKLVETFKHVTNDEVVNARRKEGDELTKNLNETQWQLLRDRCKTDLFFLSKGVLRYNKLSKNLHGDVCNWFTRNRAERNKEILLPRSHYKSTILTESHSVQIILPYRDEIAHSVCFPETLGTNCRVLIAHEVSDTASKFLLQVTAHLMNNAMLMNLFPEIVPNRRDHRINLGELELPRTENWKESTFTSLGTGKKAQGYHFNYLKLDDLIGDEARDSKVVMQRAKDWFDNIQSLLITPIEDHMDVIGTRWAFDDLYEHINQVYGKAILKYIRGAEEILKDAQGKPILDANGKKQLAPIFPEKFTTAAFEILKKNKKVWSSQYANNPAAGGALFEHRWKRFYTWVTERVIKVNKVNYSLSELDICILIDPAMTGLTGFVVTGMTPLGDVIILDAQKKEWRPPDFIDVLFNAVDRWNPRVVAIEKVLFSGLYEYWLRDAMKLRQKLFRVEPISTGNKEKEARVLGLSNYYAAGQIWYHTTQLDLIIEHDQFGATDNYHMLDALAQGPLVWRRGYSKARLEEAQAAFNIVNNQDKLPESIGGY